MRTLILSMVLLFSTGLLAQVNDMYYVPKKKSVENEVQRSSSSNFVTTQERLDGSVVNVRDEDEYNRRYSYNNVSEDVVEYDYEEDYSGSDEQAEYSYSDDTDYQYTTRIVRFHSPRRMILSSPWYWDVVYNSGVSSWTLYDDGIYWDLYSDDVYYPTLYPSWSFTFGFGGWGVYHDYYWYRPWRYNYWHSHYNPYWCHTWHDWHYHGYRPPYHIGGPAYRPYNRQTFADLRTGGSIGRRGNVAGNINGGNRTGTVRRSTGNASGTDNNRTGTVRRNTGNASGTDNNRTGTVRRSTGNVSGTDNNRTGTVRRSTGNVSGTDNNRTGTVRRSTGNASGTDNNRTGTVRRSSDTNSKTYNRPSSTRSTQRTNNVQRQESNRSSSGSYSRSSGSSSRSSSGSMSRGGSSRSGGRR